MSLCEKNRYWKPHTVLSCNLRSHFRELIYMGVQRRLSPICRGLAFGDQRRVFWLARVTPLNVGANNTLFPHIWVEQTFPRKESKSVPFSFSACAGPVCPVWVTAFGHSDCPVGHWRRGPSPHPRRLRRHPLPFCRSQVAGNKVAGPSPRPRRLRRHPLPSPARRERGWGRGVG